MFCAHKRGEKIPAKSAQTGHPTAITTSTLVVEFRSRGANCGHVRRLSTSPLTHGKPGGCGQLFHHTTRNVCGHPITAERAVAFIEGNGLALAVATGRLSAISKLHELLYPPTSYEARTEDQEYERSRSSVLKALFTAAAAHIPLKGPLPRQPGTTLTKDIMLRSSRTPSRGDHARPDRRPTNSLITAEAAVTSARFRTRPSAPGALLLLPRACFVQVCKARQIRSPASYWPFSRTS
ncbi:hypothetical protein HNP00_001458 [Arthrobacter sp. AZCC_0090]|nr:hypothetical protein [Arthrobacter sp. AZCC_0090]